MWYSYCIPTAENLFELRKAFYSTLNKEQLKSLTAGDDENLENVLNVVQKQMDMLLFNWENDYFMAIACLAALRSKDPRTPVSLC